MRVGVPAEIKSAERRVGLTPSGAARLVREGHQVVVESGAGRHSGFDDDAYRTAGARLADRDAVWEQADLLVKVKEPVAEEYRFLRRDLTLFAYLHLAADRPLTQALLDAGTTAIAFETVRDGRTLPLLQPMSEIAGRLAAQAGAHHLQASAGGPGMLIGGVPGVAAAKVVVIGGGAVGTQAALVASGMMADVTVLDASGPRVRELTDLLGHRTRVLMSDDDEVARQIADADIVIGAVLVPGAAAPKLVRREHLRTLPAHALLVDVAIDQGGCFETSRPTTWDDPTFDVDGITHYCVANMPGTVPRTATRALANATTAYVVRLTNGVDRALGDDPGFAAGLNVADGAIVHPGVARAFPDLPAAGDAAPARIDRPGVLLD
ncbi:alanine dehydrogenase [Tersicoccus phoenicis]|uniref:Alanine dehydrogenase n=1 Tax=Tersicoccus phoenicis TaxID=554083 RepID=A0A1R1LJH2_9MICC|nr:alanine dehydrogenase [Tersicoccus phoenicis]OMH27674.1 alanine dehydrogenase [Tersicoccus phoenicis]